MLDAGEDCRVADLESVEVQDRQNRPVRDRIKKFIGLPAVANGPVSASPSPTMQATISPGLSNAAPKAWLSDVRARRPRESIRASSAPHGSKYRQERRTA